MTRGADAASATAGHVEGLSSRRPPSDRPAVPPAARPGPWLTLLCLTLLGYALFGKGWAYVGVPPLFVGEAALFCGLVPLVLFHRWRRLLPIPAVWTLFALMAWGLLRTWPDVPRYGTDALRDAEQLAGAIDDGSDHALAEYQAHRDAASVELFDATDAIASFNWDLNTLRGLHDRFMGTVLRRA